MKSCNDYQMACFELLDRTLSPEAEARLLAHVRTCPACAAFLEEEQARCRSLNQAFNRFAKKHPLSDGFAERLQHAVDVSVSKPGVFRGRWLAKTVSFRFVAGFAVIAGLFVFGGTTYLLLSENNDASPVVLSEEVVVPVPEPGPEQAISTEQGEENMTLKNWQGAVLASGILLSGQPSGAASVPTRICISPETCIHWTAVCTNEIPLVWEYPEGAASATLRISGMSGKTVFEQSFAPPQTTYVWTAFSGAVPTEEDVYTLMLDFGAWGVQTGQVAIVKGSFGGTPVNLNDTGRPWTQVTTYSVIPYDGNWVTNTVGAKTSSFAVTGPSGTRTAALAGTGYYGLNLSGSGVGDFTLTLTYPSPYVWTAMLTRDPEGTRIILR